MFFLFSITFFGSNYNTTIFQNDSIHKWINQAKNKNINIEKRKKLLLKSYQYTINRTPRNPIDLSSIAYEFYKLKDTVLFKKVNNDALRTSKEQKNYFALGDTYWNLATFYVKQQIYPKAYYHFNKAYKAFNQGGHEYEKAKMLYGMAHVKGRFKDFHGSEALTIKAIETFKVLKKYKDLYKSYNHLGLLQKDIKEYSKALFYYNKSLEYYAKIKNKKNIYLISYNNIGNIYKEKGFHKKAIEAYNKDLGLNPKPIHYAVLLSNKAHAKLLLKDTLNVKKDLYKALAIRDSIGDKIAIIASKIYISDYYKYISDTINALKYATEANLLAKQLKNGGDYLTTLNQLANLDSKNSKKYLDRYIEFNDSLISAERRIQNKFTRIEFETDEYIEETKRLSQQRIWILITSFAGILILSLLYFLGVQKAKNEKLSLESEQQKANEEVYILTLQQQAKLEEEKIKERNRISEELHDGILGRLFGTRFGLGFLNIEGDEEVLEKHQTLLNELQDIEKEIRDVSHKLSDNFDGSNINFISIIEQLLKDKSEIGNFKYQFISDENISWKSIDEITKANVYRIIQEALQNIIKHAEAKNITLSLSTDTHNLIIHLKDDGKGFNVKKKKTGIGIKNINSRIKKLKGTVQLDSEINNGTLLSLTIPLKS